jgi:hypothetical protein
MWNESIKVQLQDTWNESVCSCRIRGMNPNTFTLYVEGGQSSDRFSLSIAAENAEGIWSPLPNTVHGMKQCVLNVH